MASSNVYCQLGDVKGRLGIRPDEGWNEAAVTQIIETVSRLIDEYCSTRFFVVAAEVRHFTARRSSELIVGDFTTITSLKTDDDGDRTYEKTWNLSGSSDDVDFYPDNAALEVPPKPYWKLLTTPNGDFGFPVGVRRGVELTGSFGYCTLANLPPQIREAAVLQTIRLYERRKLPFGVYAMPEAGTTTFITSLDPDVKALLAPFHLVTVA